LKLKGLNLQLQCINDLIFLFAKQLIIGMCANGFDGVLISNTMPL
jgi:hypothetical protein